MARGTTESGGTYFYVKPKNLKADVKDYPCMDLQQKKGEVYEVVETVSFLTGYITEITKVDKIVEKYGRMRGCRFTLTDTDANEKYVFDLLYSGPVRELINRLASLPSFKDQLKISFYRGDKGFAGASVKVITSGGAEKVDMKYGYKEHLEPRMKKVEYQGKTLNDYTGVDDFFDALIDKVLSKYEMVKAPTTSTSIGTTVKDLNEDQHVEEDAAPATTSGGTDADKTWKDDLPF